MDIYILRDGKETGPFTEKATQSLLKQGSILINDLAWRPGMPNWQPLHAVLYPAAQPNAVRPPPPPADLTPPPMPPAPATSNPAPARPVSVSAVPRAVAVPVAVSGAEAATGRQKAFLSYIGIPIPGDLTREKAALLVNDEMENPKDAGRLQRWNQDRFRLHPDLFADEIKTKKENRANFFYEVCQGEGAEFFEKVTKAHTQVLVEYLDKRYPNWDARDDEAKYNYLFPAIAEKFPQLLKRGIKGRFKYPEGPKVAPELSRRSAMARHVPASSPLGAIVRGLVFGAIILAALYFAIDYYKNPRKSAGTAAALTEKPSEKNATTAAVPAVRPQESANSVAAAPAPNTARNPFASDTSKPTIARPADPLAQNTAPPRTGDEKTSPIPAPGTNPVANMNLFGPDTSPPAATPSSGVATVSDPFNPLAPTAPVPLPAPPTPPPGPAPRATVKVTKPTLAALRFGSSMQRPGTILQLVGIEGTMVKVRIGPEIVSIPAANTDINDPEAAPPPPAPAPTAVPAPTAPPASAPPPGNAP